MNTTEDRSWVEHGCQCAVCSFCKNATEDEFRAYFEKVQSRSSLKAAEPVPTPDTRSPTLCDTIRHAFHQAGFDLSAIDSDEPDHIQLLTEWWFFYGVWQSLPGERVLLVGVSPRAFDGFDCGLFYDEVLF